MENSRIILLFWTTIFFNYSIATSFSAKKFVFLNSTGNYNAEKAKWKFNLNYAIPSSINATSVSLRVVMELLDHVSLDDTSSLFTVGSKKRFKHVEIFGADQGVLTIDFDHVYSGHYKLEVLQCRNRFNCYPTIHESDLGVVRTNLNNINVTKINMRIRTTPTAIGGIDVEFAVKYFNVSNSFLPFDEFVVSLLHSDEIHTFSKKVIGETKAEFRPCANLTSDNKNENQESTSASADCFNILNEKYTTRIDPIDSRCNFPAQIVVSSKYPCRRYIIANVTLIPTHFGGGETSALYDTSYPTQKSVINSNDEHAEATVSNGNCSFICRMLDFILNIF